MRVLNIYQVLMYSIPEAIVVTTIAFALAGAKLQWKKVLLVAIPTSLITVTLRPYLSSISVNNILYYSLLALMLYITKTAGFLESFASAGLTGGIYLMNEIIYFLALEAFFGIDFDAVFADGKRAYLIFLIEFTIVTLISVFLNKRKISIFPKNKEIS